MKYFFLFLALIYGSSSFAETGPLGKKTLNYDIQWGHIIVGRVDVTLDRKYNRFILKLKSKSEGMFDFLYNYKSELLASSYKEDGVWKSISYITTSDVRDQKYYSKVYWDRRNNKLDFKIDPPLDLEEVHEVLYASLKKVVDPMTALLEVIEKINKTNPCDASFRIFDGRRRYDLSTQELPKEFLINDRPRSFSGDAVVCGLRVTPIGGHRIESKWKPELDKFSDIKIFFGIVGEGGYLPVRMHINRWFGTITLRLLSNY
jgi:hypothetical protein